MKIILLSLISLNLWAIDIEVTNKCHNSPAIQGSVEIITLSNVADITLEFLNSNKIPYIGNETGIKSLLNTPQGLDAIEVLSDSRMRVYGWCFTLDGHAPDKLMNQVVVDPEVHQKIKWFYGFAELIKDEWVTYCTPAYKTPESILCH